ncbi:MULTISPECIES: hypothetical protein [unclassified Lysobacter]|uniref:hypothetical protein n=1 Tax=unclassified Lysobacter TaxID=2635362 RepID=UPI001C22EDCA|nr:hypothetical protein [Lysobacter sp. MMG2]MBU8975710.1 hypothetical protein [Lysobacter sp. MMG2]
MNQQFRAPTQASLAMALVAALFAPTAWAAFDSGSTGADGVLNPTASTEIQLPPSGILNYTTINIPVGVSVKFKRNAANTPVYILASGDVTIAGTIDVRGEDGKPTGTYGNGAQADDALPGEGGPGGFRGGRGGGGDAQQRVEIIRGGAGLGPGGGPGGIEGGDGCTPAGGYYKYVGTGGGYANNAYKYYTTHQCAANYGPAGLSYGSTLLQPLVGGSGGGGGRGGTNYPGSGGGGGGGAILIASSGTLRITGSVDATGGDGAGHGGTGAGGQGAGGSGGAIRLVATTVAGNGTVYASGGCINYNGNRRQYCGYDGRSVYGGSEGRIRIEGESVTYNGTSQPTYVRGDIGPVFIANAPALRISSVAGQAVAAVPTGTNDVNLPDTTTGPVVVGFETTNVPVGNTVQLRIVPASGTPSEAISPAITGTTAAGTAQVSVTLPRGSSTLQATTTYTVVIAALEDEALREKLSRLAQNERVEKVEVTVALHGGARARLITDSGKSFDLPYEALSEIGFKG